MDTIYDKIDLASVFVADVSFVSETSIGKKIPNPNVLLEIGYAARSIGWDRIILVMNKATGSPDELPFDLKQHRFPLRFELTESAGNAKKSINQLSAQLIEYIRQALNSSMKRIEDKSNKLDSGTLQLMAKYREFQSFPMPDPPKTMGQTLISASTGGSYLRLLDFGAVVFAPEIAGYHWTQEGKLLLKKNERLLNALVDGKLVDTYSPDGLSTQLYQKLPRLPF